MDFEDRLNSHYRLAVLLSLIEEPAEDRLRYGALRVLSRIPGRAGSASMIQELLADYGHQVTRAEVAAVLSWLDRSRLIRMSDDNGALGALLLDLGRDVVAGVASVPGVSPAPNLDWLAANLDAKSIRLGGAARLDHVLWLAERQLVLIDDDGDAFFITHRGRDVAAGREEVEGVRSPSTATILRLASNAARSKLEG